MVMLVLRCFLSLLEFDISSLHELSLSGKEQRRHSAQLLLLASRKKVSLIGLQQHKFCC